MTQLPQVVTQAPVSSFTPKKYFFSTSVPDGKSRKPCKIDQEGHTFKKAKASILLYGRQHLFMFIRQTTCNYAKNTYNPPTRKSSWLSHCWGLCLQRSSEETSTSYLLAESHLWNANLTFVNPSFSILILPESRLNRYTSTTIQSSPARL